MSSLPTNPFSFQSASLTANLPISVKISSTGTTGPTTILPSASQMFQQALANNNNTSNNTHTVNNITITSEPNHNSSTPGQQHRDSSSHSNQSTAFAVSTDNINRIATSTIAYRDRDRFGGDSDDDDDDNNNNANSRFDVFKTAQEHLDQTMFQTAFDQLDVNSIAKQREEIDKAKLDALQDSLEDEQSLDSDWMTFLTAFDAEVSKVEADLQKQQELDLNNSLALIGDAIKNNTTISLPSQSKESRELTEHIQKLYAEFNEKKKTKEVARQQKNHNVNNTVGIKPFPGLASKGNKNKKAAHKAMDRFSRLEAMSHQESVEQRRRQGNGQVDFLNDHSGPYKKQSQANKKKNKKLDW